MTIDQRRHNDELAATIFGLLEEAKAKVDKLIPEGTGGQKKTMSDHLIQLQNMVEGFFLTQADLKGN